MHAIHKSHVIPPSIHDSCAPTCMNEGSPLMGGQRGSSSSPTSRSRPLSPPPSASPPGTSAMERAARLGRRRRAVAIAAAILLAIAAAACAIVGHPRDRLVGLLDWLRDHPSRSPCALAAAVGVGTVLGVSGNLMWTSAGAVVRPYGLAALSASVGMVVGSSAAFVLSRLALRPWVSEEVAARPRLGALDRAVRRRGFRVMLALRLALVFPYTLLNYVFGASGATFGDYLGAAVGGTVPSILVFAYVGSLARDVRSIAGGGVEVGGGRDGNGDGDGGGGSPVRYAVTAAVTSSLLAAVLYGIFVWAKRVVREEVEMSSVSSVSSVSSSVGAHCHEYEQCRQADGVIWMVDSGESHDSSRGTTSTGEETVSLVPECPHGHTA